MAGHAPSKSQILRLAAWLEPRISTVGMFMTDRLSENYPDAAAYARDASGLLATFLPGAEPALVLWFRVEQVQEIMWAGNPHEPLDQSSRLGALNPRKSFAVWRETVKHRSRPWDKVEVESVLAFANRAAVFLQQQRVDELNTLLRDANERLAQLALTDALTGIANRRAFDERLREDWARARRIGQPVGLLILDLDFFKQYNDHFGHPTGDECLKRIAELLRDGRRAADFAARVGGEEFAVLLPHTDLEGALAAAEGVRGRIEKLGIAHPNSPFGIMTASIGVASAPADGSGSTQDIMKSADRALYKAKSEGRNRVAAN
jgi:diguanylate cyclase (GGDEF)-like protein